MERWGDRLVSQLRLIVYLARLTHEYAPDYLPLRGIHMLAQSILPLLSAIIPSLIIDELTSERNIYRLAFLVGLAVICAGILQLIQSLLGRILAQRAYLIDQKIEMSINDAYMRMEYMNLENDKVADLCQISRDVTNHASSLESMIANLFSMIANCISILGLSAIIGRLVMSDNFISFSKSGFSEWIASNSLFCLSVAAMICVFSTYFSKKIDDIYYKYQEGFASTNRAYRYYGNISKQFAYAKDIRLFRMYDLIQHRMDNYLKSSKKLIQQLNKKEILLGVLSDMCMIFQMMLVYFLISFKVLYKAISLGEFYLYTSATTQLIILIRSAVAQGASVRNCLKYQYAYKEILKLVPVPECKAKQQVPEGLVYTWRFDHISFKYPGTEEYVLRDLSFTLNSGEKVAMVGKNGAGKTTIIKLLLRLYKPTTGTIYLNGLDIQSFDSRAYNNLFSVVFQDFKLLSCSLALNVAASEEFDQEKVKNSCEKAGIWPRLQKSKGIETPVTKLFNSEGIEFSGGEAQKLAIARAFYRNTPVMVMDEPTAALDPISELEIYHSLQDELSDKTAIFISHRLSSCRFCDRIFVIDKGAVIQQGSHEELLEESGKLYAQLWNAQAKYYA